MISKVEPAWHMLRTVILGLLGATRKTPGPSAGPTPTAGAGSQSPGLGLTLFPQVLGALAQSPGTAVLHGAASNSNGV